MSISLPVRIITSLHRYQHQRVPTGDFLRAILENNLLEAVMTADDENIKIIPDIVHYIYNYLPSISWGSKERVEAWLHHSDSILQKDQESSSVSESENPLNGGC
jgi:hypothetical protein